MQTRKFANRREFLKLTTIGAAGAAIVAACGPAATPTPAPKAAAPTAAPAQPAAKPAAEATKPAAAPTKPAAAAQPTPAAAAKPAAAGPVTVTLWWEGKLAFEEKIRDDQVKDFEKKYPNVKIKKTLQADIEKALITGWGSGTGPDVSQMDGPNFRKQVSDAGYIMPLDKYYQELKWPIFPWARNWSKIKGVTWEVPYEAQTHGVYYNITEMKKLGITLPKTYDELSQVSDDLVKQKKVPWASDNKGGTNIQRLLMTHLYAVMTVKQVNDILFGDAPYNTPEMLEVVERVNAMFRKGWIDAKLANTLDPDSAAPDFASGKNIFIISGNFNAKRFKANLKNFPDLDWGYMDLPPINKAIKSTTNAGIGCAFGINAKSMDKIEACLRVIEYNTGADDYMNKTSLEQLGFFPAMKIKLEGIQMRPDDRYVLDSLNKSEDIGLQTNKLWPSDMLKYEGQAGMGLALGEVTPKEFVANLAKMWDESKGKGTRWVP